MLTNIRHLQQAKGWMPQSAQWPREATFMFTVTSAVGKITIDDRRLNQRLQGNRGAKRLESVCGCQLWKQQNPNPEEPQSQVVHGSVYSCATFVQETQSKNSRESLNARTDRVGDSPQGRCFACVWLTATRQHCPRCRQWQDYLTRSWTEWPFLIQHFTSG